MSSVLAQYKEQIAALNPLEDSAFLYDNVRWSQLNKEAKKQVSRFEGAWIRRADVIDSFRRHFRGDIDYLEPFVMTMIWGFSDTGYGTYRTNKYLSTSENRNNIKEALDELRRGNREKAYRAFVKVHGLNVSYISKLLYFGTRAKGEGNYALIFDIRVARSIVGLFASQGIADFLNITPSSKFKDFERYNNLIHQWASDLEVEAENIEMFLFNGEFNPSAENAKTSVTQIPTTQSAKIECLPLDDPSKRFLLGVKGKSSLLAIGLNPSTANENKLDPTSRNIQAIAKRNGCDGWYLINLYPHRASKPIHLPKEEDTELSRENIEFIKNILSKNSSISKVLCCWGNMIDDRPYLRQQAQAVLRLIEEHKIPAFSMGLTQSGNPLHPAPMTVNTKLGGISNVKLLPYTLR